MKTILILAACSLLCGCSHLYSHQVQPDGTTTDLHTTTFFDSKSELAKYLASQTDKTQRLGIGALNAESSATNAVNLFEAVARGAATGASRAAVPAP